MTLIALAFLGGVLTIVSPCILPVLPFVFARAGQPFLRSGLPMLVGMAAAFTLVATLAAVAGGWAVEANEYGRIAALTLVAVFGLTLLFPSLADYAARPLVALGSRMSQSADESAEKGGGSIWPSLVIGLATGLLWAPCAGPVLGLILTGAALQGPSAQTSFLLLAYAAGAATSLALALLVGGQIFALMKRSLGVGEWVRRALGVAVLASVAAIALGLDTGFLTQVSLTGTASLEQGLVDKLGGGQHVASNPPMAMSGAAPAMAMKAADATAAPAMAMKAADTAAAPVMSMKAADTAAAPAMAMKAADAGVAPVMSMKAADTAAAPVMSMKAADAGAAPVMSMKAADTGAAPVMSMKAADTAAAPAMAMKAAAPPAEVLPDQGAMPALAGATQWLNSPPLTADALKGKVVLVDFWTYSCINCLREIPYIRAWAEKYRDQGLVVIGVHAPEFAFEKSIDNVRKAVADLKITYPVAIDNDYAIWRAFANEYWPAIYFVDAKGRVRHNHFGEGDYDASERIIQQLLAEAGAQAPGGLVAVNAAGAEAAADAKDMQSPETYLGYDRAANFASPGGAVPDAPHDYAVPANLALNGWGLSGNWTIGSDDAVLDDKAGALAFRFHARDVHMVLGTPAGGTPVRFRVKIDGAAPGDNHGADVDADGVGVVTGQRLYQLVRQNDVAGADHTFEIEFLDPGVQAYTFTFG